MNDYRTKTTFASGATGEPCGRPTRAIGCDDTKTVTHQPACPGSAVQTSRQYAANRHGQAARWRCDPHRRLVTGPSNQINHRRACPWHPTLITALILLAFILSLTQSLQAQSADKLAVALKDLNPNVLPTDAESRKQHQRMLYEHAKQRLFRANNRVSKAWRNVRSVEHWKAFVTPRIEHMRNTIADYATPPKQLRHEVTKTIKGDGFTIRNVVYESSPGLLVAANLYSPTPLRESPRSMPGILIVHSHHRPKTHGELQDMGMNWARQGCYVLVPDQLNHGERRQHPFVTEKDYAKSFRVSRQGYYFRFNVAMHLYLAGDSLVGQMAWDNMRGFDLLLQQENIDSDRLAIIGSVAGGGDPAAVTAALDPRIDCLVPFNFGGPQPETRFPLPDDIETSFNYAGSGSWESTRNIAFSAAQPGKEFLPWVIVSSIAPRHLIHAHEFNWDHQRDPVWKRYQTIWGDFYDKKNQLGYTNGHGELKQSSKVASHCTHVGPTHRKLIYKNFKKWFGITTPEPEYRGRIEESRLLCMTAAVEKTLGGRRLHQVLLKRTEEKQISARAHRAALSPKQRREQLKKTWTTLLGLNANEFGRIPAAKIESSSKRGNITREHIRFSINEGITVPALLLKPVQPPDRPKPAVVIMIAQGGKVKLIEQRADAITRLLANNIAICLPDLRGTGETAPGSDRGQYSWSTSLAASELMLGRPLLGSRLSDLLQTIAYLRTRKDLDGQHIALWGDSFSKPYATETDPSRFRMPLRVDGLPRNAEPLGPTLALLAALFDDDIKAVRANGGLISFGSLLDSQFIHVPFDAIVPGVLMHGDLPDIAASLAPLPLAISGSVDGWNRLASHTTVKDQHRGTIETYRRANASDSLSFQTTTTIERAAIWIISNLQPAP